MTYRKYYETLYALILKETLRTLFKLNGLSNATRLQKRPSVEFLLLMNYLK